jgi:hypothetical protein
MPQAAAAAILDVDGDSDIDLYLGRDGGFEDELYYNDGAEGFTRVVVPGSTSATSTGAFADFDGDTDLDYFLASTTTNTEGAEVVAGTASGDGVMLFLQEEGGAFVDATDRLPQDVRFGWTFQGSPLDADADGTSTWPTTSAPGSARTGCSSTTAPRTSPSQKTARASWRCSGWARPWGTPTATPRRTSTSPTSGGRTSS